jgi:hypothetical protein
MINRAGTKSAPNRRVAFRRLEKSHTCFFFRDSRSVVDSPGLVRACEYYPAPSMAIQLSLNECYSGVHNQFPVFCVHIKCSRPLFMKAWRFTLRRKFSVFIPVSTPSSIETVEI